MCFRHRLALVILMSGLTGCGSASEQPGAGENPPTALVDHEQFTQDAASEIAKAFPSLQVEHVGELRLLLVDDSTEQRTDMSLSNHYDKIKDSPEDRDEEIAWIVQAVRGIMPQGDGLDFDKDRIVPLVRSREWLEDVINEASESGGGVGEKLYFEPLNEELLIIYAIRSETTLRKVRLEEIAEFNIDKRQLLESAVENLDRVMPVMEILSGGGVYMITAGGTLESSILLFDEFWSAGHFDVPGETVVAVPARDVLLITGSDDPKGLLKMESMVAEIYDGEGYSISPSLFVRRDGKFVKFERPRLGLPKKNGPPGAS